MHTARSIPLILLAAGGSVRMGSPKQLLPFRGSTLLRHAVDIALASPCRPIVVVLGAAADRAAALLVDLPVQTVINADWQRGMGSSIRVGMELVLKTAAPAVVIMLCDQPAVTPTVLEKLLTAHAAGASIAASSYDGIAGVPAVIGREWFEDLQTLDDAAGARQLFKNNSKAVVRVSFTQGSIDVDTPKDYEALRNLQIP